MLGCCQKFTPKPYNNAELKKRLDFRVLLQLVDVLNTIFSLNTEMADDIQH